MHKLYVDVPYSYKYVYHGESAGPEVLTRDFGATFKFVCNAYNKTVPGGPGAVGNYGDAHLVELNRVEEETFFLIKSGFTKLNTKVVEDHIQKRGMNYETNYWNKSCWGWWWQ